MKKICILILISIVWFSCSTNDNTDVSDSNIEIDLNIDYEPEMVGPGVISKSNFEGHASITPDGKELYFAVYSNDHRYSTIVYSVRQNGKWVEPEIVSFSGKNSDGSPALSPNGNRIYFSSKRPKKGTSEKNSSNDLWFAERKSSGKWGNPKRLNDKINTSFNEFSPSADQKGNLYFCSNRPGGFGDMDIYFAENSEGSFKDPVLLDENINSQYKEGNVGVSPDGKMLFLMLQHKPGDYGYDDIHYAVKQDRKWNKAINIGTKINTYTYDFSPKISPDGKTLFFSSRINKDYGAVKEPYDFKTFQDNLNSPLNGFGNIYKIELSSLNLVTND